MKRFLVLALLFLPCLSEAEGLLNREPVVGIPQNGRLPILARGNQEEKVRVSFQGKTSHQIQSTDWFPLKKSDDYSKAIWLEGIEPKTPYQYRVEFENGSTTEWIGLKGFTEEGKPGKFRFIFSSCFREKHRPHDVFEAIQKEQPDFVALLGDTMYADFDGNLNKWRERDWHSVLNSFRGKYHRNLDPHFQDLFKKIPLAAIWDDHDYGVDNSDGSYRYKEQSKRVFLETFPMPRSNEKGEGLYYRFRMADIDFFVLDTRWYKSRRSQKDGIGKTMLGEKQLQWLLDGLMESEESGAPFKVIFSSVPWNIFGGGEAKKAPKTTDSWSGYKRERQLIQDYIKEKKIRGVAVLSGDQHLPSIDLIQGGSELTPISKSKDGIIYSLKGHAGTMFEVSASPIHTTQAWRPPPLPVNPSISHESISLYRPSWWGDSPAAIPDHLKRVVSIYGLVEVDGVGSSRRISITIKELREKGDDPTPLFKLELLR